MDKPSTKSLVEELPETELEVLAALWNDGPQTAAELRATLQHFRPMAHGSVLTLLKRLAAKGLVERTKSGRGKAFLYHSRVDRRAGHRQLLRRLTERIFGNNLATVVASLLSSRKPTAEELAEIRQMLDSAAGSSPVADEGRKLGAKRKGRKR